MAKLKAVSLTMAGVMLATSLVGPGLATAQQFDALWLKRPVSQWVSVTVPAEKWRQVIRVKKTSVTDLYSYQYRDGDRWLTLGRTEAAMVPGLSASQMSTLMRLPKREATMVFARYVPQESQLVINGVRVEEGRDGYMYLLETYFTPYSGENWAASRAFLTDSERRDVTRAGRNPFEAFKGADRTDPKFMNIGWDGAMVAVGLAMKHFGAVYSVMSVQNLRMAQHVESHGSFLRKTTTVKVDGYAQPTWFIGMPTSAQTWGTAAAICVVPTVTSTDPATGLQSGPGCPDQKLIAFSGVSFDQWNGGTMPMDEEHIYHWEQSQTGFTVLFYTAVIMAAAFFAGPEIYAMASGGGLDAAAVTGIDAAGAAGGAYAGGTLLTTSGSVSLTSVKNGAFGTVGSGVHVANGSQSQQVRDASAILVQRQIDTPFDPNSACSDNGTLCSTQAAMQSASPDPNKVVFRGDQQGLRVQAKYCSQVLHLQGDAFNACVAPRTPPVDVP